MLEPLEPSAKLFWITYLIGVITGLTTAFIYFT
jgi:hypothetical protein